MIQIVGATMAFVKVNSFLCVGLNPEDSTPAPIERSHRCEVRIAAEPTFNDFSGDDTHHFSVLLPARWLD